LIINKLNGFLKASLQIWLSLGTIDISCRLRHVAGYGAVISVPIQTLHMHSSNKFRNIFRVFGFGLSLSILVLSLTFVYPQVSALSCANTPISNIPSSSLDSAILELDPAPASPNPCQPVADTSLLDLRVINTSPAGNDFSFGLPQISETKWNCQDQVGTQKILGIADYDDANTRFLFELGNTQGITSKIKDLFPGRNCQFFKILGGQMPNRCGLKYQPGVSLNQINPQSLEDLALPIAECLNLDSNFELSGSPVKAEQIRYEVPAASLKSDLLANFAEKNQLKFDSNLDVIVFTYTTYTYTSQSGQVVSGNPNSGNSLGGWLVYGLNKQVDTGVFSTVVFSDSANVTFNYDASAGVISWKGEVLTPTPCYEISENDLQTVIQTDKPFNSYKLVYGTKLNVPDDSNCTQITGSLPIEGQRQIRLNEQQLANFSSLFSISSIIPQSRPEPVIA
jgi:hypothetical protein